MHFEHHNNYEDRGLLSNPDCHPSDSNGIHGNWTRIEARKQRKKVQNRINQRAHSEYTGIEGVYCPLHS